MSTINGTDMTRPDRSTDLAGWFAAHDGLLVVPLHNPVLDRLGHHPTSSYAEHYWVPTIGPTASLLHRRLAAGLERHPDGDPVHLPTLAREIGLGAGTGRSAPLTKALVRLVGFNLAEMTDGRLAVRPTLPPLTRRQAAHLPAHLGQRHHRDALVRPVSTPPATDGRLTGNADALAARCRPPLRPSRLGRLSLPRTGHGRMQLSPGRLPQPGEAPSHASRPAQRLHRSPGRLPLVAPLARRQHRCADRRRVRSGRARRRSRPRRAPHPRRARASPRPAPPEPDGAPRDRPPLLVPPPRMANPQQRRPSRPRHRHPRRRRIRHRPAQPPPSGRRYQWTCGQPLAPAPDWLLDLAREPIRLDPPIPLRHHPGPNEARPWARAAFDGELARIRSATHGSRNHTLNRSSFALGQLIAAGHLHHEPVRTALLRAGLDIGLTPREVQASVASGLRAGSRSPRVTITSADEPVFQRRQMYFPIYFPYWWPGSIVRSMVVTPFGSLVEEVPLPRAPLVFVVAQARFERVASISSEDFIAGFQEAIRSTYPVMQRAQQAGILLGPNGQVVTADAGTLWRFEERPEGWQVVLAPDFVALSTKQYTRRQDLIDRFNIILCAAQHELRVRFCDRLGVRYVDRVTDPVLLDRLGELVKPEVLGAMALDAGEPGVEHVHHFVDATYRLPEAVELHARWGVLPAAVTFDPAIEAADTRSWVLDLDASTTEQVAFDPRALVAQAEALSGRIYRFFRWAVEDAFLVAHGGRP